MSKTIEDIQNAYAQAVSSLVPPGYSAVVRLERDDGRKKRKNAAAWNWSPSSGSVSIKFVKSESSDPPHVTTQSEKPPKSAAGLSEPLADAIRALDAAERRASFVSIKWFRDQFLPSSGASWAASPYAAQGTVKEAIDRGLFLTSKVPNPKTPAYPTTAIRLNRQMPEVQRILCASPVPAARSFQPVEIAGEPLSATIGRERR